MIPKSYRLRRELVKDLLDTRRFFHTEHLLLRVADSPLGPRLGVSVSKKVSKSAVARNRVRRRVYSAVIPLLPDIGQKLCLVVAKPSALTLKGEALERELALLLKKG